MAFVRIRIPVYTNENFAAAEHTFFILNCET